MKTRQFMLFTAMRLLFRIIFQYSFPPSSVGEVGRIGAPSRREIGHGTLAERALEPILPPDNDFPYTIRVESTITESNGSSRWILFFPLLKFLYHFKSRKMYIDKSTYVFVYIFLMI